MEQKSVADNQKKAIIENMSPSIQALEKSTRRRGRRIPKKERKILKILDKIKNKKRGR